MQTLDVNGLFGLISDADTNGDGIYSIEEIRAAYGPDLSES